MIAEDQVFEVLDTTQCYVCLTRCNQVCLPSKKKYMKMDMVVVNRAWVVKLTRILDTAGLMSVLICSFVPCAKNCCPSFSTQQRMLKLYPCLRTGC